jgi:serine phosphatase RsbU (regulator of sigma subunit)
MAVTLLSLSILVQSVAAVLAFRLNGKFGWRWAWTLLSLAILLMTLRRCVTLWRVLGGSVAGPFEEPEEFVISALSAVLSLMISSLILVGLGLIEPIFRKMIIAEALLCAERDLSDRSLREHEEELQIARQIQHKLFPEAPPDTPHFDIDGLSIPCSATGGDYFDYIATANGGVSVVLGDVSGHGVGSALLMAAIRAYVRTVADPQCHPGTTLTLANRCMSRDMAGQGFVTMFFASLHPDDRSLTYVGAGHMAHWVRASGEAIALESTAPPLNVIADLEYVPADPIHLDPGDIVFVVSDGITEAMSPEGQMFGYERAPDVVRANVDKTSREIAGLLFRAARDFAEGASQIDDTTIVVVKSKP